MGCPENLCENGRITYKGSEYPCPACLKAAEAAKAAEAPKPAVKHTAASIRALLEKNDAAVERAVVVLYDRQTQDEKVAKGTKHTNGVGFNKPDSSYGSYVGKWCKSGKHLTGKHLGKSRKLVLKYAGQLAAVANAKAAVSQEAA